MAATGTGRPKTYAIGFLRKKVRAVVDVSLSVERGEIFGLLGPNGAGKTTTLRMLLGLSRPDAGRIAIGEAGLPPHDPEARRLLGDGRPLDGARDELGGRRDAGGLLAASTSRATGSSAQ